MILPERVRSELGSKLLQFECLVDVYNPSVPFVDNGEEIVAGRAEERSRNTSVTVFFRKKGNLYSPVPGAPTYSLEDPSVSRVQDSLVFGGVEVNRETGVYKTVFYVGTNIYDLKFLAMGPPGMKDIRLVELADGTVGVFARPQGEVGGRGKVGFIKITDLGEINERTLSNAPLIEDQFGQNQWGGVNQAILLADGTVGVIGHKAWLGPDGKKHYVAMGLEFDPESGRSTRIKIIASRKNFPETEAKSWDLGDVVFPAGLVLQENGSAELYAGVSDVAVGRRTIDWPFRQLPRLSEKTYPRLVVPKS